MEAGSLRVTFRHAGEADGADAGVALGVGDLAFLARGDSHRIHPSPDARWVEGEALTGDDAAARLLEVRPPAIIVRGVQVPSGWLAVSLQMLVLELDRDLPGARIMVSRILDLLIIQSLRKWANDDDVATQPSALHGALDPVLSPILSRLHARPEKEWTVTELAAHARMSRSAFSERFTRTLGRPAAAYLQDLRLERAADLLATTAEPIGKIASAVGYTSSSAFSRAFAQRYGASPRRFRQQAT